MPKHTLSRRTLLQLGIGGLFMPIRHWLNHRESVCLGVIADLHHGLEPRATERLEEFMQAVRERKPDAIIQLGDFNYGPGRGEECMELWRTFKGPRYHVLGNHDMDFATKEAMVSNWQMPSPYYSFDLGGYHAVVLDRNNLKADDGFTPYSESNFYVDASLRGYADDQQLSWLREDLAAATLPVIIFVHQGLGMPTSMSEASRAIEEVLEEHNRRGEGPPVVACFCGHHHIDRYTRKNGIHYLWINSASYYWVGADYGRMAHYSRALYTFMTLRADGMLEVEASHAEWESPTPAERNYPRADELTPFIRARRLQTAGSPPD
ncbi:MAG: metallophosphoesterase [Bacteroidota bacterium]|nr:metallophosphoesterase [Bacteroidota bacterium]